MKTLTRKQRYILFATILSVIVVMGGMYAIVKNSIIRELSNQSRGVAIAVAAAIDPSDLVQVEGPEDMEKEAYVRVEQYLRRCAELNPDVLFIYTMRRSLEPGATSTDYQYIVDIGTSDDNGNGAIEDMEIGELPGAAFDASPYPQLVTAWDEPVADYGVAPADDPYPAHTSGYAPIKNAEGRTIAIVGADCVASVISRKLVILRLTLAAGGGMIILLSVFLLYSTQLQRRVKELKGLLPICAWCKQVRDDAGYWQRLDWYIAQHADVDITHGICPSCMKNEYPQYPDEEIDLIDEHRNSA